MIRAATRWWNDAFSAQVLSPKDELRLSSEHQATNRWRIKRVLPLMILLNLAHVFMVSGSWSFMEFSTPKLLLWRDGLWWVHLITAAVAAAVLATTWKNWLPKWQATLAILTYQLHAAAITGVDQLNHGTVAPYIGYSFANVFAMLVTPRQAFGVYAASSVAFVVAVVLGQPDPILRWAILPSGPSTAIPVLLIILYLHNTRRKDFYFRETIARQRVELAQLNGQLQHRVDDQLASLTKRTAEVDTLNIQLQEQVIDRSLALARALSMLGPAASEALEGRVLAGHFRVGPRIGEGGMGLVHRGHDIRTNAEVAIKVVRSGHMDRAQLRRFIREVRTAASLKHPSIVRMFHVDVTEDGLPFQIQELVHGETLASMLQRFDRFHADASLLVLRALTEALHCAHDQGIVHRDIKPGNIMLTGAAPGLKLLDFGIAKESAESLTATGGVMGTPAYMGPELWHPGAVSTAASDLYSLGMTAHRMLAGSVPTPSSPRPEGIFDLVPAEVSRLLNACLCPKPDGRPALKDLLAALRAHCPPDALELRVANDALGVAAIRLEDGDTHLTFGP